VDGKSEMEGPKRHRRNSSDRKTYLTHCYIAGDLQ
jgi:hypothetical protein